MESQKIQLGLGPPCVCDKSPSENPQKFLSLANFNHGLRQEKKSRFRWQDCEGEVLRRGSCDRSKKPLKPFPSFFLLCQKTFDNFDTFND